MHLLNEEYEHVNWQPRRGGLDLSVYATLRFAFIAISYRHTPSYRIGFSQSHNIVIA